MLRKNDAKREREKGKSERLRGLVWTYFSYVDERECVDSTDIYIYIYIYTILI
ncbi:hypothetical protein IC007_0550 [Sulfuracidifex tepidarius]|uniref:Uncharacterized protein n=1 Tax=Sulfuracidifex tepidarius TaxID=1294262 RepID=A0A510E0M3_9CREN|nr:hypothetical protein IC007_0550 [Sulfuracidifex tepidarius]